jgi:hypothetical protein
MQNFGLKMSFSNVFINEWRFIFMLEFTSEYEPLTAVFHPVSGCLKEY